MQLKFEKKICRYLDPAVWDVQTQELTQEIRLPEGMPDASRVICAWGQMILRSKEWLGDTMVLSGGVMAWVLYAPEDGSEPRCLDAWLPFRMKWELPDGIREGDIRAEGLLRFVDGRNVSPRKILVRAGAAVLGEALTPGEAEVYMPMECPQEVSLLKRTYPVRLMREAGEKSFQLDEELTLPESMPKPAKLLCCTVCPEITEQKVTANKAVFRGNGNLRLLYVSDGGQVHGWEMELPFSQLAQLDGDYTQDAQTDVRMFVTNLESELDDEGHFRIKCGLVGQYLVDDQELLELVEDAYSVGRDTDIERRELRLPALLERRTENIAAEQIIPMEADLVADCRFLPDFPRRHRGENGVQWELPGVFQVLCYEEHGLLRGTTARWEGKLSVPADEESILFGTMGDFDNPQTDLGESGLRIRADGRFWIRTLSGKGLPMVTAVTLGEKKPMDPHRPSLILRRAGEDDLWNLAKKCGSTVEAIQEANGLQEEAAPDRLLLIPVLT